MVSYSVLDLQLVKNQFTNSCYKLWKLIVHLYYSIPFKEVFNSIHMVAEVDDSWFRQLEISLS